MSDEVPEVVGSYLITKLIATRGMSTVYRGEHQLLGRGAAIEVLRGSDLPDDAALVRFAANVRAAAIRHPGLVEIYDFGRLPNGDAYIVGELLEGESLGTRLRARGRLSEAEAFAIARDVASALAKVHGNGLVHRDIKPDKIYLCPDPDRPGGERAKLLGLGYSWLPSAPDRSDARVGILGTPNFMAPERCHGLANDHRADLYSLGCVLMTMLTGQPPFAAASIGELLIAHCLTAPPALRSRIPDASDRAEMTVAGLLAKAPAHRISSAAELVDLLSGARARPSLEIRSTATRPAEPTGPLVPTLPRLPAAVALPPRAPSRGALAARQALRRLLTRARSLLYR